ncbi:MAG: hypothetical protein R2853_12045 [Thermomicrobiales bacterium]
MRIEFACHHDVLAVWRDIDTVRTLGLWNLEENPLLDGGGHGDHAHTQLSSAAAVCNLGRTASVDDGHVVHVAQW